MLHPGQGHGASKIYPVISEHKVRIHPGWDTGLCRTPGPAQAFMGLEAEFDLGPFGCLKIQSGMLNILNGFVLFRDITFLLPFPLMQRRGL